MKTMMMARNLVTDLSGPRYAIEVARQLALMGNQVLIPTSNPRVRVENVQVVKLPGVFANRAVSPIAYSSYARFARAKYRVEIVHGNGYSLFDDVTTVHFQTRAFEERFNYYASGKIGSSSGQIMAERIIWKSSKHLIAVSNMVKQDLVRLYGVSDEKISVVHNGVTLDEFSPSTQSEKEELLKKYGLESDKLLLLFVGGSAYERKGFRFLLEALPQFSSNVMVIAVCRNLAPEFRDVISRLKVSDRIIIESYIPDISKIYRAVDMYVLPTIYDPFPLAVLEAMASKLPVIVSSLTGAVDIIENGRNGMIIKDPRDAYEFSNAVNVLAESETARRQMASNARGTVEKMSWKDVAREVRQIYESVAK